MTNWARIEWQGSSHFGSVADDVIELYQGNLFDNPQPTGETIALGDVKLLPPLKPNSILALWNNFHERAEKEGQTIPITPLYFMKPVSSVIGVNETIFRPRGHSGKVIFEAELGIVIGKACQNISADQAAEHIFGYTCVNDVTAINFLFEDKAFQQWTRSKGFDTFTPLGPWITTDLELSGLRVQAVQGGEIRQDYPVADMIYSPYEIVSHLSQYQTLVPGDLIACGTSVGARTMKPGSDIDIVIEGIGTLHNSFADYPA
jgi:2-keto-4-pentenoate hydratase/2-oxohepta-3-ene-1,7-dioic acid hydratase in catechol pathway